MNSARLDAIVVIGAMAEIAVVLYGLMFWNIPQPQLPIVAGLAGTIFGGTIGAYAGARWQNAKPPEPKPVPTPAAAEVAP
jgi:uncharacterized membrane protein YfcA